MPERSRSSPTHPARRRPHAAQHELAFYALESLPAYVAVLDARGATLAANRAWRSFMAGVSGVEDAWEGLDFLAVLDAAGPELTLPAAQVAAAIRTVLAGDAAEAGLDYACPAPEGGVTWLAARVTAYAGPPPGKAVVTIADITAQKEAELALRRSEERYRQVAAAGSDLALAVRVLPGGEMRTEWAGGDAEGVTGFTVAELIAMSSRLPLVYADDRPRVQAAIETLLAGAPAAQFEFRTQHKDGTLLWVSAAARRVAPGDTPRAAPREITGEPTGAPSGAPSGAPVLYVSMSVIEARKQDELVREATEQVYRQAQAVAQVGHWTWDTVRNHVTWSDEMMRIFGLDPQTFAGDLSQVIAAVIHPDDLPNMIAANTAARAGNPRSAEYRIVHPDGSVRHILAVPVDRITDDTGQVVLLTGIAQDITVRKQAEARVAALHERITQLVNSVPEAVLLLDAAGVVLLANPRARGYLDEFGERAPDARLVGLAGRSLDSLLTSPPRGRWHLLEANRRTYEVLARPLEAGPALDGWVVVLRDVTDAQFVQAQLQRQERLAAVGQLAAGIAHDFNNLLSVILMYAEMVGDNPHLGERDHRRLATIAEQAQRASNLIRQVLDFSRRSVLDRAPLDLLPLLTRQTTLLHHSLPASVEVALRVEPGEYRVLADPTRLEQVVMNLAVNARDAMPHGGTLRIELGHVTVTADREVPLPGMAPARGCG